MQIFYDDTLYCVIATIKMRKISQIIRDIQHCFYQKGTNLLAIILMSVDLSSEVIRILFCRAKSYHEF